MQFDDLTGRTLNGLEVVEYVEAKRTGIRTITHLWRCRCKCGALFVVARANLIRPHTTSCGCHRISVLIKRSTKHGHGSRKHRSGEYRSWAGIRQRCTNPNNPDYQDYGARGITVCARWLHKKKGFANFLADMGPRPSKEHSVERINTNGNYTPKNCKWGTRKEQARNKRNNRVIIFNGKSQCLVAWAEDLGVHASTLHERLHKWTLERALTAKNTQA